MIVLESRRVPLHYHGILLYDMVTKNVLPKIISTSFPCNFFSHHNNYGCTYTLLLKSAPSKNVNQI